MTLRTLNYGNYGIFPIKGNAGFCPSTVSPRCGTESKVEDSMDLITLGFRVQSNYIGLGFLNPTSGIVR